MASWDSTKTAVGPNRLKTPARDLLKNRNVFAAMSPHFV